MAIRAPSELTIHIIAYLFISNLQKALKEEESRDINVCLMILDACGI